MRVSRTLFAIPIQLKSTMHGTERLLLNQLDGFFIQHAVVNQIRNRTDFKAVFLRKHLQIWPPRHRAIVVHDFDDHRRRL